MQADWIIEALDLPDKIPFRIIMREKVRVSVIKEIIVKAKLSNNR